MVRVLEDRFPDWRGMTIHESSPCGAASKKFARECRGYVATHYYDDVPSGCDRGRFRCEDLERQTFPDESFDLVITQDVFEHLFDPARAFSEVARTLKAGGAHVFTVPWYQGRKTLTRAERVERGGVRHVEPPEYHGNPIDADGSLVVREWGDDLFDFIREHSGLITDAILLTDRRQGIDGEFREVFVSRKGET